MKRSLLAVCMVLVGVQGLAAQSPPRLVPASGVARDAAGNLHGGTAVVTFAIYAAPEGGKPLWTETQSLTLDAAGQYSTLLGLTAKDGLPNELFAKSEARWLAVSIDGAPEGPRTFWASVPYALKAADAETVNGLPLEAFMLNGAYRKSDTPATPTPDTDGMPAGVAALADNPGNELVATGDLYVYNSACVGFDCVSGGEVFGSDTIRLKENNMRIHFDDTSVGSFPANDWRIVINDTASGGANYFAIEDSTAGRVPFTVEAGARANALYVESDGDVGFGTASPVVALHSVKGNTPTLRLDQDASSGFTPQVWDLAGNETSFFVRDVTNGSTLPFRIRPGAPSSSIDISNNGRVGIGRPAPAAAPLDVRGTATTIGTGNAALKLASTADVAFQLDAGDNGSFWNISMRSSEDLVFSKSGTGATEALLDTAGNLTLRGNLTLAGNCSDGNGGNGGVDGCDRVFHPDYPLPSIESHAAQMWDNGYLPAVGPTPEDAPWNLGLKAAGMLNELEKAHIYIDQLQRQLKEQQQQFEALKSRLDALERQVVQPR